MSSWATCFLFLDNPRGGVEDIAYLKEKAPWIKGILLNVHSHTAEEWQATTVIDKCKANGLFYGPWARPEKHGVFIPEIVDYCISVSDKWKTLGLINPEKEIDSNQDALNYIVAKVGSRDYALSVQPTPFASIDWSVAGHLPILPQIMPVDQQGKHYDTEALKQEWWKLGVKCIYMTFGVFGGMKPTDFVLKAPYSLFTGDPIMASYSVEPWAPTSSGWVGCNPNEGEDDMPVGTVKSLNDAYDDILNSSAAQKWRTDNPGEYDKVQKYFNAPSGTEAPTTGINTEFGKGLIALIEGKRFADGTHA